MKKNFVLIITFLFLMAGQSFSVSAAEVRARQASEFINSIGVVTHLDRNNVYGQFNNIIKPRLIELGIKHIRDPFIPQAPSAEQRQVDLYNSAGIKTLLLANPKHGTAQETVAYVKRVGPEKFVAIEGINEPDNFIRSSTWVGITRNFQRQLYEALKSDPATAHLPILGPALTKVSNANALGDLSAYMDYGNIHPYYGGRNPETRGWGSNDYGSITWGFRLMAKPVSQSLAVWATETGLHNAESAEGNFPYTPEDIAALYLPRQYLYFFSRGIIGSYTYEFANSGTNMSNKEHNFGMIRNDGTPKPAYYALKNLITLLKDTSDSFSPEMLNYSLEGDLSEVYHLLLQKSDGTFYIAIWVGKQDWNPKKKLRTFSSPQNVSLKLGTAVRDAAIAVPNDGTQWITAPINDSTINVTASNKVTIIRLKDDSSPTTGRPTNFDRNNIAP
jgi:hypothetical protein